MWYLSVCFSPWTFVFIMETNCIVCSVHWSDFCFSFSAGCHVIVLPSYRDVHHDYVYPQPPFFHQSQTKNEYPVTAYSVHWFMFSILAKVYQCCEWKHFYKFLYFLEWFNVWINEFLKNLSIGPVSKLSCYSLIGYMFSWNDYHTVYVRSKLYLCIYANIA